MSSWIGSVSHEKDAVCINNLTIVSPNTEKVSFLENNYQTLVSTLFQTEKVFTNIINNVWCSWKQKSYGLKGTIMEIIHQLFCERWHIFIPINQCKQQRVNIKSSSVRGVCHATLKLLRKNSVLICWSWLCHNNKR